VIIRNDDVAFDTNLDHLERFCRICDRFNVRIMQAITFAGVCVTVSRRMSNWEILNLAPQSDISLRTDLITFLKSRPTDLIAAHGLFHTHSPNFDEVCVARDKLTKLGLSPSYYVPPFNEGNYGEVVAGMAVSGTSAGKLEECIAHNTPARIEIMYLHSWRFDTDCSRQYVHPSMKRRFNLNDLELWLTARRINGSS